MATLFLETSALVKLYVSEPGSEAMIQMASRPAGNDLVILSISRVELVSAVRRRERLGDLSSDDAQQIQQAVLFHESTRFLVQPVSETVVDEAVRLLMAHSLRAYDAIQLAGYLTFRALRSSISNGDSLSFVCADRELLDVASAEGVPTRDPLAEGS